MGQPSTTRPKLDTFSPSVVTQAELETTRRNLLRAGISLRRDHSTDGRARQFGAFWRKAGNSQVRESAWWRTQSQSNLSPPPNSRLCAKNREIHQLIPCPALPGRR